MQVYKTEVSSMKDVAFCTGSLAAYTWIIQEETDIGANTLSKHSTDALDGIAKVVGKLTELF